MKHKNMVFDIEKTIHLIQHYLPAQSAIKDFVHHNPLHAFQADNFHDASRNASLYFGATTYLSLEEYRNYYKLGEISELALEKILETRYSKGRELYEIRQALFNYTSESHVEPIFDSLRKTIEKHFGVNLNKYVHPRLFRMLASYLDQGIKSKEIYSTKDSFLSALRFMERESYGSFFDTQAARDLFLNETLSTEAILAMLVEDENLHEQYLFEQQFAHPGWSGFVSVVEKNPQTLIQSKVISLHEMMHLELILELDAIFKKRGQNWSKLHSGAFHSETEFLSETPRTMLFEILATWQEAFEWTYFDKVLWDIQQSPKSEKLEDTDFQALFCIDDRSISLRKHLATSHPNSETFGTPGFFGIAFYYQPHGASQYTKSCPAPMTPQYLIQEIGKSKMHKHEVHFSESTHGFLGGLFFSMTLGFWSIIKLILGTFKPSDQSFASKANNHMHPDSQLQIDFKGQTEEGLKLGFTVDEMAEYVKNVLLSIGLTKNYADLVYIVGHGASSVNNPYYAGYDCGACSGRPGSVNARVFAYMVNKQEVRELLLNQNIKIPDSTLFVAALHDTTCDEITFYDETIVGQWKDKHLYYATSFHEALLLNANERCNRFDSIDSNISRHKKHQMLIDKSKSLFEPRPEWNHTDNALCIVGLPNLFVHLNLDKRAFLNSYDHIQDPEGKSLAMILGAAIPVCGGINLEYYFSRMDQQKYGAGTKLPHNVMGLFALTNGIEDDLRPGLPSQMIEIHTPTRLLFVVEQKPSVVNQVLTGNPTLMEWVKNQWVLFCVIDPVSRKIYRFEMESFVEYAPVIVEPSSILSV